MKNLASKTLAGAFTNKKKTNGLLCRSLATFSTDNGSMWNCQLLCLNPGGSSFLQAFWKNQSWAARAARVLHQRLNFNSVQKMFTCQQPNWSKNLTALWSKCKVQRSTPKPSQGHHWQRSIPKPSQGHHGSWTQDSAGTVTTAVRNILGLTGTILLPCNCTCQKFT